MVTDEVKEGTLRSIHQGIQKRCRLIEKVVEVSTPLFARDLPHFDPGYKLKKATLAYLEAPDVN